LAADGLSPASSPLEPPTQRRPASDWRALHDDEPGALKMLHKAFGDNLGHDLVGVVYALAALVLERVGERRGKGASLSASMCCAGARKFPLYLLETEA
jgi:hypothetical protein